MTTEAPNPDFFKSKVLGHPAGLFVLFFTEMWERFSFYGMRVLLINFLTMAVIKSDINPHPGWGWSTENAGALFGTYAGLLYLTPILGGMLADKYIGYRWAVFIGSVIMTMGHISMMFETEFSLYAGLALLVIGTGFFKPNMTSIISEMYKDLPGKKDGAYTIFYMGVNAGAFFGMMLCGYIAENVGWAYGFGLAGIFMLLGTLQFLWAKPLFGNIGGVPSKEYKPDSSILNQEVTFQEKRNPFTLLDKLLIIITSTLGIIYLFNDPLSKIGNIYIFPEKVTIGSKTIDGAIPFILTGLILFLILIVSRIIRYQAAIRDRMFAFIIFALFTVIFTVSFEQGATSLVLFARDFTDRSLEGNSLIIFNIINTLLTVIPLILITWVLWLLFKKTKNTIPKSNIVLFLCFAFVWGVVIWMLKTEFQKEFSEVTTSFFSTLNSFFIITFASFFSKWWGSKYNPSASVKFGIGLIIMAIGFGILAYGTSDIPKGAIAGSVRVSMVWLVLAYLFHTLGELCVSPLGLSYASKLVPGRMIAFMFGMWYLAIAIGNKLAASMGGKVEEIGELYNMSTFFQIFTIIPIIAGIIIICLNPLIKKLMHGVR